MHALNPCPFCAEPAPVERLLTMLFAYVECPKCGAHGPMRWGAEPARDAWNQRPAPGERLTLTPAVPPELAE